MSKASGADDALIRASSFVSSLICAARSSRIVRCLDYEWPLRRPAPRHRRRHVPHACRSAVTPHPNDGHDYSAPYVAQSPAPAPRGLVAAPWLNLMRLHDVGLRTVLHLPAGRRLRTCRMRALLHDTLVLTHLAFLEFTLPLSVPYPNREPVGRHAPPVRAPRT